MNDETVTLTQKGFRTRGVESRQRALEGAIAIAHNEGLEGLSFGRIANLVGMAKSSVQALFGDRFSLQQQTLQQSAQQFREKIKRALLASENAQTTPFLSLCRGWFKALEMGQSQECCLVTATAFELGGREGQLANLAAQLRSQWKTALRDAAESGRRVGELNTAIDLDQLIFEILAFQSAANVAHSKQQPCEVRRAEAAVFERIQNASNLTRA
jgi:AcrR family transcriptional regulator